MHIFAREGLVPDTLHNQEPALLLEGSWPAEQGRGPRWSLDDCIDARHAWIDAAAQELAEQAANPHAEHPDHPHLAWLHALGLRYYLVRLLRPICFFRDVLPRAAAGQLQLTAHCGRDDDYAFVLAALAEQAGGRLSIAWQTPPRKDRRAAAPRCALPSLRGFLAAAHRLCQPRGSGSRTTRVLLCGSPRVFDPLCEDLLQRHTPLWWLHERFPYRCWWRWRARGIVHLACTMPGARRSAAAWQFERRCAQRISFAGIDLTPPVEGWLAARAAQYGPWLQCLLANARLHLHRVRPHLVLLDEDATPFKRGVVALARRMGAATAVIQHGAECVRFGFVPLAADSFIAWSAASRDQLVQWGAPADRVLLAESPLRGRAAALPGWPGTPPRDQPPRVLLLATVPPAAERPDSVALHLTPATFQGMLRELCLALERCAPGCTLIVKPHPRTRDAAALKAALAAARCCVQWTTARTLAQALRGCHLIVSMYSTAGLEAAAAGWPVVQLLPDGSSDILPPSSWGLLGSARSAAELEPLLRGALHGQRLPPPPAWAAAHAPPLAARILELAHPRTAPAELTPCT